MDIVFGHPNVITPILFLFVLVCTSWNAQSVHSLQIPEWQTGKQMNLTRKFKFKKRKKKMKKQKQGDKVELKFRIPTKSNLKFKSNVWFWEHCSFFAPAISIFASIENGLDTHQQPNNKRKGKRNVLYTEATRAIVLPLLALQKAHDHSGRNPQRRQKNKTSRLRSIESYKDNNNNKKNTCCSCRCFCEWLPFNCCCCWRPLLLRKLGRVRW